MYLTTKLHNDLIAFVTLSLKLCLYVQYFVLMFPAQGSKQALKVVRD